MLINKTRITHYKRYGVWSQMVRKNPRNLSDYEGFKLDAWGEFEPPTGYETYLECVRKSL